MMDVRCATVTVNLLEISDWDVLPVYLCMRSSMGPYAQVNGAIDTSVEM